MRALVLAACLTLFLSGCASSKEEMAGFQDNKEVVIPADTPNDVPRNPEQAKAKEAAQSIRLVDNAEIANIKRHLELISNPKLSGYMLLLSASGQPVRATSVRGKITSSGKRLTSPLKMVKTSHWWGYAYDFEPNPMEDGTHGGPNEYIYYWTAGGEYIQWHGDYMYSDKPFVLKTKPMIDSLFEAVP